MLEDMLEELCIIHRNCTKITSLKKLKLVLKVIVFGMESYEETTGSETTLSNNGELLQV